jgi:hypothetical protein
MSIMCRVHPDKPASWQAGELCEQWRCQPLTRSQMQTVTGMGRPPIAVLQLFDVPAMRQAGTGPAGYGQGSRCRKRPGKAYGMRAVQGLTWQLMVQGLTWQLIAIKLGYSTPGNCLNAAKRYALKQGLPFPPVPFVDGAS